MSLQGQIEIDELYVLTRQYGRMVRVSVLNGPRQRVRISVCAFQTSLQILHMMTPEV